MTDSSSSGALRLGAALAERYRVDRELGSGGMATVYLASDLRHDRQVAIKVLHSELAAVIGAERFLGEIRTTANLQHPHILGLIDSGEVDGVPYYVMPYVAGESLRDRLTRERQLPVEDAIRLTREVASALDYAHRHGVIHRDIKPENILLQDGSALVADFGIALAVSSAGGQRLTQTGLSLGTPAYMAPEQAMGERQIDARADIYSLGAVLYEMLAGEPPFTGPTAQAIVAKVITEAPRPVTAQRALVPPAVAAAVQRALQKLPADRFSTAAEMSRALGAEHASLTSPAGAPPARRRRALLWAAPIVLLILVGAAATVMRRNGAGAAAAYPPSRLALLTPTLGGTGLAAQYRQIAFTPDGSAIVFVSTNEVNGNSLSVQALDETEATIIQNSRGVFNPKVSADGRWILGYRAGLIGSSEVLMRISMVGGSAALVYDHQSWNATIGPDGSAWFSPSTRGGVAHLDSTGAPTIVIEPSTGAQVQQVFDDGESFMFVRAPTGTSSGPLFLYEIPSKQQRTLIETPVVEARAAAGYLVYATPDGVLWAAPFDARAKRVTGEPVEIARGVTITGVGFAQFDIARNGNVAYIPEEPRSLVLIDRNGSIREATSATRTYHAPKFSPDGRRISVDLTTSEGRDVWVLDVPQRTLSRATFSRDGHDATWTPDGTALTYTSFTTDSGVFGLYRARLGSAAAAESLLATAQLAYTGQWLAGQDAIVTTGLDLEPGSGSDIALVEHGGRGPITPVVVNRFETLYPAVSPDGQWLAFVSNQSGTQEVYVRPLRSEGVTIQVSQNGGSEPVWAPNGKELYYRGMVDGQLQLVAAGVRTSPALEITSRTSLFGVSDMLGTTPHANYDVSPDGKTFVMVRRGAATRVVILQNLPELVRRARASGTADR